MKNIVIDNKEIFFTQKEWEAFEDCGLQIDSDLMKLILHFNNVDNIQGLSKEEIHDVCIEAICAYSDLVLEQFNYLKSKGLVE